MKRVNGIRAARRRTDHGRRMSTAEAFGLAPCRRHDDPPGPSWLVVAVIAVIAVAAALFRLIGG